MGKAKNVALKIERGIPVPQHGNASELTKLLRAMEVGDSVLIHDKWGLANISPAPLMAVFVFGVPPNAVTKGR